MMKANRGQKVWERVLRANTLRYPCEDVVRWLSGASKRVQPGGSALDIGFGSGQHLRLFDEYGFQVYGTELLDVAFDLDREGFSPKWRLIKGDLDDPALRDSFFDLILGWGSVVSFRDMAGIKWNLEQLFRLCRPGAEVLVNFRSRDNWFFGLGVEESEAFFRLDDRAHEYEGATYTFLEKQQCCELCSNAGFTIRDVEKVERWKQQMSRRHSWFILSLTKAA